MRNRLLGLFLLALAAGCVGDAPQPTPSPPTTPAPVVDEDWAALALPAGANHDHNDPGHHRNLSTPNFRVSGWDPLITDYHGATSGAFFCGGTATTGDRRLAVTHSFSTDVALVVVDVTDPAAPKKVGELSLPRTHVYDADVLPDGSYAVLATNPPNQADPNVPTWRLQAQWTDACGRTWKGPEQEAPFASGVVLVDLADPTNPVVRDYVPQPTLGAHSVFATVIDGQRYVLASVTNLAHPASYFSFFRVDALPGVGGKLVPIGGYDAQYPGADRGTPLMNGHVDGWIQKHPKTHQLLAYLANWDGGLIIVRIEGDGRITTVGAWNDFDANKAPGLTGQVHEALPMGTLWNGTHYTFVGQEIGMRPADRPTGQVVMLDTTDPAAPKAVAHWTLPVDADWGGTELLFSTHYIAVVNQTLFVSLYHGGVWAVDASPSGAPNLPTLGVFVPDRQSPKPPPDRLDLYARWTPMVLDVLPLPEGRLVTFDALSGVYLLEFDESLEIPQPAPWTRDDWKP